MGRVETKLHAEFADAHRVHRFVFLLLPGFSSLDLASGIESLAAANAAGAYPVFCWEIVSENGDPVASFSGMQVQVDGDFPPCDRDLSIIICGPQGGLTAPSSGLKSWLRRSWRTGSHLCGLSGGAVLLAELGLATGARLSTHWALEPAVTELFPDLEVACSPFEHDNRVSTSGGGAATLDLFSSFIARKTNAHVAEQVADRLLRSTVRSSSDRQTKSDVCRFGYRNEKLQRAIQIIQNSLEDPRSPAAIATEVGLSTRQLERIFNRYVGVPPKAYMLTLRLDRARILLQQTQNSVTDVGLACGFSTPSHFSRLYRKQFGISPHHERGRGAGPQIV